MKKLLFVINVGWYYELHWKARMQSKLIKNLELKLCMSKPPNDQDVIDIKLERSSIGLINNIQTFVQLNGILKKHNPDFLHSVTVKPNIMLGLLSLKKNIPLLMTVPGLGSMFSQKSVKSKIISKIILMLYKLISKNKRSYFVFENRDDQSFFIKKRICSSANSTVVSGSGVDINEYKSAQVKVDKSPLRILFASRLLRGKGLHELVIAVKKMRTNNINVVLSVAGIIDQESNEAIPVNELEDWDKEGIINWLGQINENMVDVISNHDVVVLPTKYAEGLPRILIEANACSRPVITTDVSGCKDFVKNGFNGLLISKDSEIELFSALKKMTNKAYCKELGMNGRHHVLSSYTLEHVINEYCNIYRRLFY